MNSKISIRGIFSRSSIVAILLIEIMFSLINLPAPVYSQNTEENAFIKINRLSGASIYVVAASNASAQIKAQADVICDGTADQVEINAAITAGHSHIVLSSGTFSIASDIVMDSNIWLQGQGSGTIIKLTADDYGLNCWSNGVTLSDFTMDGDNKNTADKQLIQFTSCSQITVRNLSLVNSHSYGMYVETCHDGFIDNIYCTSSSAAYHDGVHLHDSYNFVVNNIRGTTGDDLFAITAKSADSYNITATNIVGTSTIAQLVRISIYASATPTAEIYGISVSNISGTAVRLLFIGSNVNGTISRVNVNNITGTGGTNLIYVDTSAGGTIADLYIDGFNISTSYAYGVFINGVTRGALTNGSILNCSNHSILLRATTAFKCDNINIKTTVKEKMGVAIENANDLILNNITSDVPGFPFWFAQTASTKVRMTNCKPISGPDPFWAGIQHDANLTDSVIANNDLSQPKTKIAGAGVFTNVSFQNNVGYNPAVTTNAAIAFTTSGATLNGNLTALGTATAVNVSFKYGTTPGGPYPNSTTPVAMSATASFNAPVSGLAGSTTYYYQAVADGGTNGVSSGAQQTFTTIVATSTPPEGIQKFSATTTTPEVTTNPVVATSTTALTTAAPAVTPNPATAKTATSATNTKPSVTANPVPVPLARTQTFTPARTSTPPASTTVTAAVPAAPMQTFATGDTVNGTSTRFQWSTSPGATYYWLTVRKISDGTYIMDQSVGDVTTYTISGLPNDGTQYKWAVAAGNSAGRNTSDITTFTSSTVSVSPAPALNRQDFLASLLDKLKNVFSIIVGSLSPQFNLSV